MSNTAGEKVFNRVTGLLQASKVNFEVVEHQAFTSSEEASTLAGVDPSMAAKSLLMRSLGAYMLAVLPADQRLDSKKLKHTINSGRLSFASPEELMEVSECEPGTCHPFGNLLSIPVYMDQGLAKNQLIACNAGLYTKTLLLPYADYVRIVNPTIANLSQT